LVYRGAFAFGNGADPPDHIARVFGGHGWTGGWRDSVYDFDHYHSTAHEVLGCYRGHARIRLGGPSGVEVELDIGDAVVIPAGVAHMRLEASNDFGVVGAYAGGRTYDMNRGRPRERPTSDANIADVPRPAMDPVFGEDGPLLCRWE
jgi:uncharacterized protein YjlB